MSDNVTKGEFTPPPDVGTNHDRLPAGSDTAQTAAVTPETPEQARARISQIQPMSQEQIDEVLKQYPQLERNLFDVCVALAQIQGECALRGKLLSGLLYQNKGQLSIDCLPMSNVKGNESFQVGEGRFKTTWIRFAPKMVEGSSKIIQG